MMKDLMNPEVDQYRLRDAGACSWFGLDAGGSEGGAFTVPYRSWKHKIRSTLRVIAGVGEGWDHVSVSLQHRCPTWDELEFVKRLFFQADEVAFQLHMPPADHISIHPFCLHLWRPHDQSIPIPPSYMV